MKLHAKGTPEDSDAVRSRLVATQVNTNAREDVTQATPPIKASRIIVSQAATKCLIGRHDIRVAFFHANGSGRVVIILTKGIGTTRCWVEMRDMGHERQARVRAMRSPTHQSKREASRLLWSR